MPQPTPGENKNDYIGRCVKAVMAEGKTQDQALGQCHGMWEHYAGKSAEGGLFNVAVGASLEAEDAEPKDDPDKLERESQPIATTTANVAFPAAPEEKLQARRAKVSFETTEDDTAENMAELLEDIGKRGSPGHSFDIIVDPQPPGGGEPGKHGFDGDGHDRLGNIEVTPGKPDHKVALKMMGENGMEHPRMPEEDMMAGKAEEDEMIGKEREMSERGEPEEEERHGVEKAGTGPMQGKGGQEEWEWDKATGQQRLSNTGLQRRGLPPRKEPAGQQRDQAGKFASKAADDRPHGPPPGELKGKKKRQLVEVYDKAREAGYSKERSAKQAWGATKKAIDEGDEDDLGRQVAHLGPMAGEIRRVLVLRSKQNLMQRLCKALGIGQGFWSSVGKATAHDPSSGRFTSGSGGRKAPVGIGSGRKAPVGIGRRDDVMGPLARHEWEKKKREAMDKKPKGLWSQRLGRYVTIPEEREPD